MIATHYGIPHAWQSPALPPKHLQVIWPHHLMFVAEHQQIVDPKAYTTLTVRH